MTVHISVWVLHEQAKHYTRAFNIRLSFSKHGAHTGLWCDFTPSLRGSECPRSKLPELVGQF